MEADFWHNKWQKGEIGFHETAVSPVLTAYISQLAIVPGDRLFVPLCGKTLDIGWALAQGYRVVGAELSNIAVTELFAELGLTPQITPHGPLTLHSAANIDIWEGDIFALNPSLIGAVNAIYDRAALIALPAAMRIKYTQHLRALSGAAPQLLVTLEYDQTRYAGPPFSVDAAEINRHYQQYYHITALTIEDIPGGLKGLLPASTTAWLLQKRE